MPFSVIGWCENDIAGYRSLAYAELWHLILSLGGGTTQINPVSACSLMTHVRNMYDSLAFLNGLAAF